MATLPHVLGSFERVVRDRLVASLQGMSQEEPDGSLGRSLSLHLVVLATLFDCERRSRGAALMSEVSLSSFVERPVVPATPRPPGNRRTHADEALGNAQVADPGAQLPTRNA
ncbi:MAG: hypothetical protein ACREX3_08925 [Gammaproteobacteria bacterium]